MGRPRLQLDADTIERLAGYQCTHKEIAAAVGCSTDTLTRRFADVLTRCRADGKTRLRARQFRRAMKGSDTMLIHLGKQYLGQSDKVKMETTEAPADPLAAYAGDPELRDRALQLERDLYDASNALDPSDAGKADVPGMGLPSAHSDAGSVCDEAVERPDGEQGDRPDSG